jgi:hypothetical protein
MDTVFLCVGAGALIVCLGLGLWANWQGTRPVSSDK